MFLIAAAGNDPAAVKAARDALIVDNMNLVAERAEWFWGRWTGRPPRPSKEELISVGNVALVKAGQRIPIDSREPTAYLRRSIDRAMRKESFREHIMHGLPKIWDVGDKERQQVFVQLDEELGEPLVASDGDEVLGETLEVLRHVCKTTTDKRIVELFAGDKKMSREKIAAALGWASTSTAQAHVKEIGERYQEYLNKIENPRRRGE